MKSLKFILIYAFLFLGFTLGGKVLADSALTNQDFIDMASIRSTSEIETAKFALEKASTESVKAYARVVIKEQSGLLDRLRKLAKQQHLHLMDNATLQAKAKVFIFQRNGKVFDPAYAEMRAMERRKAVGLFREAAKSQDNSIKQYAIRELPVLMRHLYLAQAMVEHSAESATLAASN